MVIRHARLAGLLLICALLMSACATGPAPSDPGVNLGDPEVGGGAGEEAGPETPVPPATATSEGSPRLDATAAATLAFPPTATPTVQQPTAIPEEAVAPATATSAPPPAEPEQPQPTAAPTAESERIHVVKAGENLYRIGLQYGLSWVAIAEYNGITDPNQITVGQELRIPPSPTATPTTTADAGAATDDGPQTTANSPGEPVTSNREPTTMAPPAVVAVSPGDTLYTISRRYGVSWAQIAEANGLEAPNQLYPGQLLKIPPDVPGPPPAIAHQVHSGDTLSGLAHQYGRPLTELAAANGLTAPYTIYPGQTLVIPSDE